MNSTNTQRKIKLLGFFLLLLSMNFSYAKLVPRGTTTKAKVVNATTITIAKPTGTLLGDVLVVNMVLYGSYDEINSEQTGWKLVDARSIGNRSYAAVFYKIAGTAEPTEYSFSVPNGSCTEISGTISGFWGNEAIDKLFDVIPTVISVTKSGNVCKVPTITTKSDEVSLVFLAQAVGTSSSNSRFSTIKAAGIPSNFTVVSDYNAGNTSLETAMLIQNKAGATGEISATMNNAEIGEGGIVLAFKKFVVAYRTVGNTPFADYQALGAAFQDINNGKLTGDVKLLIIANTNEISGAYLFGSGDFYGGAKLPTNYSSVTIYPTMPNLIISGNTTDFIINLYGADKVSIDGRVMGTTGKDKDGKDVNIPNLTIIQKNNTATTVIIANTAKNNTIKYCFLKGAGLDATTANIILKFDSIVYTPQPTTQIVNGVSTTTTPATEGNNDNTIDNCTFMGFADLVTNEIIPPTYAIYSKGVNTTSPNKNNTINECNFVDMLSPKFSSIVIDVEANSDGFKITKNKFSQTKELNYVSNGGKTQYVYVAVNQASNCVISENSINNNGKALKNSGASDITQVYPILLNIGNNNKVEKNNIENLTLKLGNITNATEVFAGIYLLDQAGITCSANNVKNSEIWSDLKDNSTTYVSGIYADNLTDYATTVPIKSTIIGNTIGGTIIKGASANFNCNIRNISVINSPGIEVSSNTVKNIRNSGFSAADIQGVTGITIEAGENKILQDPHVTTTTTNEQFPPSIVNGELVPGPTTTIITTDQQVLWSSDNTAVAKVVMATGQVFALANGTATISALASDGNITNFLVTVTDPKEVVSPDYLSSTTGSYISGIILSDCSNFIVNNNTIESLTNNDKGISTTYGIYIYNETGTITNNSVKNLKSAGDVAGSFFSVSGIYFKPNNSGSLISKNTIENLSNFNPNTSIIDQIVGIYISANDSYMSTEVSKNKISNLTGISLNPVTGFYGIRQDRGSINCNNNIVDLGESVSNNINLFGIFDYYATINTNIKADSYINNTVRIKGSTTSNSTARTKCFYAYNRNYSAELTLKNNLFLNTRTTGTGNKNYAIGVSADFATKANQFNLNIAFDYNDYFVSDGPDNYIGYWDAYPPAPSNADRKLFTDWKKVTDPDNLGLQDASSQSVDMQFDCANKTNVSLAGAITQIDTDFYDTTRDTYLMGAVESIPNISGLSASPGNSTTCKNTNTKDSFTIGSHPGYKVVKWEKSTDINFSKDTPKIDYDALVKAGTISATDAAFAKANQDFTYEQYTEINEIKSSNDLITGDEVGNIASIKDPITGVVSTPVYYVRAALHNLSGCNANDEYSSSVAIDTYLDPTPIGLLDSAIFCISAKVKELTAKLNVPPGSSFYNSNAQGNPDGGPITNLEAALHNGKYFVAPVALGGCVGPKTAFYVVIEDGAAITVTTSQSYCTGDKVEKLIPKPNLDTKKGDIIRWWSDSTGGTPLLETTILASGTYYVSKGISCGDVRKKVDITVNSIPNAPVVENLTQTLNGNTTVNDLIPAPSDTIRWYPTQESFDVLIPATPVTSRTYYVASVNASGCESTRVAVNVTVPFKQNVCTGATVADLIPAPSATFEWYNVATGGTPLSATTALTTGTYYSYSNDTSLSCGVTARDAVSVVVGILPPTVTTPITYTQGATATALTASGTDLKWYTVQTGGTALADAPIPSTTAEGSTTYWVASTINGCESARVSIVVTVTVVATGVSLNATIATIEVNDTRKLIATIFPVNAGNQEVTWSSSNAAIATVDTNGLVTAISVGSATITVRTVDGSLIATCAVTVIAANASVCENALSFDGVDDYVALPATTDDTIATSNFTIEFWYNAPTVPFLFYGFDGGSYGAPIISNRDMVNNSANSFSPGWNLFTIQDGKILHFGLSDGVNVVNITFNIPSTDTWNHIAIVVDRLTYGATVYVNGVKEVTNPVGSNLPTGSVSTNLGIKIAKDGSGNYNQYHFKGQIDELRIWNVARTQTDIQTNMCSDIPSNDPKLVANYKFNSCSGTTLTDSKGTYNGTLTNMVDSAWTASLSCTSMTTVTGITLNTTTASIVVGSTSQLTATIAPANATNQAVTWSSSNTAVATVSSTGLVTAVAAGTANITATSSADATKTAVCAVTAATVAVTGVSLTPTTASIVVGSTSQLTATIAPANATNKNVTWASSNTAVATVSTTGLVTAVTAGTATITATSSADATKTATCAVTVTSGNGTTIVESRIIASSDDVEQSSTGSVLVDGWNLQLVNDAGTGAGDQIIGLRFPSLNIPQGATISKAYIQFTCSITDAAATSLTIKGEASDNSVTFVNTTNNVSNRVKTATSVAWSNIPTWNTIDAATVNEQTPELKSIVQEVINRAGFTATSAISFIVSGTGVRTAYTYENTPAKAVLLHIEYTTASNGVVVTSVTLNASTASIVAGSTQQLTATIAPANATNQNVTWSSSNTAVATVSSTGLVTAIAAGSATITVTSAADATKTATCAVTVTAATVAVTGVTLNTNTASIVAGSTQQLTATIAPANATNQNVTWSSSNTAVATVSSTGLVTAIAAGSATITVTSAADATKTATCAVTVTAATVAVTGVTLNTNTASIVAGSTQQLTATISPANATNKNVTWTSSAPSIITVSSTGLVTAVAPGTANIMVTSSADATKTAICAVTVTTTNNLLINPGFEVTPVTTNWASISSTQATGANAHSGTYGGSKTVVSTYGPKQDVTTKVVPLGSGNYYVEAWVKKDSGTDNFRIEMQVKGATTTYYGSSYTAVGTTWTKISGVLNLNYTGTPTQINWWIRGQGTGSYSLDDCMLVHGTSAAAKLSQGAATLTVVSPKPEKSGFIKLYPNPVTNDLTIQMSDVHENETAQIYNLAGIFIREIRVLSNVQKVNVDDLPSGIYVVRFKESSEFSANFIKK